MNNVTRGKLKQVKAVTGMQSTAWGIVHLGVRLAAHHAAHHAAREGREGIPDGAFERVALLGCFRRNRGVHAIEKGVSLGRRRIRREIGQHVLSRFVQPFQSYPTQPYALVNA